MTTEHRLPWKENKQAEFADVSVLTVMARPERTAEVLSMVDESDFAENAKPIFRAIKTLFDKSADMDLVTIAQELSLQGSPIPMDDLIELLSVMDYTCAGHLPAYVGYLKQNSLYRRMNRFLGEARDVIEQDDPGTAYQKLVDKLAQLSEQRESGARTMKEVAIDYVKEMQERAELDGQLVGLSTGFKALDERMGGMRPGDLIVIAGRPGMGKSTLAMNILDHNAIKQRRPAIMFSLEMSATQLMEKQHASLGEINVKSLRGATLTGEEWDNFNAANNLITQGALVIDERGGLSVSQIRARCFEVQRLQGGLELVAIDYLQLMSGTGENRNQIISDITRGLKQLAKDLKCPVIVLSQLNRGVESRPDKRPKMSDLRESGAIEQDADAIIFPYRDDYYDENSPYKNTAQIIFGKLRMGEPGSEGLAWEGQYSRFKNLDYRPDFNQVSTPAAKSKKQGFSL